MIVVMASADLQRNPVQPSEPDASCSVEARQRVEHARKVAGGVHACAFANALVPTNAFRNWNSVYELV